MGKFLQSYIMAEKAHEGQKRDDGTDYIKHPLAVAGLLIDAGWGQYADAGVLHDTIEDTDITYEDIKKAIDKETADIVRIVSKKEGESYRDFIVRVIKTDNEGALLVKKFDIVHNLSDHKPGARRDKYELALWMLDQALDGRFYG